MVVGLAAAAAIHHHEHLAVAGDPLPTVLAIVVCHLAALIAGGNVGL